MTLKRTTIKKTPLTPSPSDLTYAEKSAMRQKGLLAPVKMGTPKPQAAPPKNLNKKLKGFTVSTAAAKKRTTGRIKEQSAEIIIPEKWEPAPYQKDASRFLQTHPAGALFLDPGLRKSSTTLDAFIKLKKKGLVSRALLIAPVRVCYGVWPEEIKKWLQFNHLKCEILHGDKKEAALERDADIYIINPEGLEWLFGVTKTKTTKGNVQISYDLTRLKRINPDILIIDELNKFKHQKSIRFQIIKPFLPGFLYRWGLTGTPAANGLMDLFGQMYMLDLGQSLGEYITHYRNTYFRPVGMFDWKLQHGAEELIYTRIAPQVFRLDAKDYVTLPKLITNKIRIELPPKVRKIYDELEDDFITELEAGTIVAANAAVASGKLRQISNGGLYLPQLEIDEKGCKTTKREWIDLHTAKVEAVVDLIDELNGTPALVVFEFQHDKERLLKALGADTPVIAGGVSAGQSKKIVDAWNRGEVPVLLIHPAAGGHGLNMQGCNAHHIIWHSQFCDYDLYLQLIGRLLRSGNTSARVFSHHIICDNTVDLVSMKLLSTKGTTQNKLLDAMKTYCIMRKKQQNRRL